jgi:hypothetical protein
MCFCLVAVVVGFNDDAGRLKWSPKYLYEKVYSVPSSSRNNYLPSSLPVVYNSPEPKPLKNTHSSFYGMPGSVVSSDWVRSRLANRFQLKKKDLYRKRASCVELGGACLIRSRFYGAMKLDCCEGTTCEKIGENFMCVAENDYVLVDDDNEDGTPTEELYGDDILKK